MLFHNQALRERPIDDQQLIGLLVLALGAKNVEVRSGTTGWASGNQRPRIAERLTEDGVLTTDPDTLRQAARDMLVQVLSCREDHSMSGMGARHAGTAIAADEYLPGMATDEFLPCLSKGALERAALANGLEPGPRAKDTRAAIASRFKDTTWVYAAARFEPTVAEREARSNPVSVVPAGHYVSATIQDGGDADRRGSDDGGRAGEGGPECEPDITSSHDDDVTHLTTTNGTPSHVATRAVAA